MAGRFGARLSQPAGTLKEFMANELKHISMNKDDKNFFVEGLLKDGIESTLVEIKFTEFQV